MKEVYDNGEKILGQVDKVKEYLASALVTSDMEEELLEIIKELKEYYKDTDIVCINYDNGMGYLIDYWQVDNKIKKEEV